MSLPLPSSITPLVFVGPSVGAPHAALQLRTRHGTVIVALHGAQVLSWVPAGGREVFWLSPQALREPAAIRGGVPLCWPWFARQGQPTSAPAHGLVRTAPWQLSAIHSSSADEVSLSLTPRAQADEAATKPGAPPGLRVSLCITLGRTLSQTLHSDNQGREPFVLTQALHSYFAVSHAQSVRLEGVQGLPYIDRLRDLAEDVQQAPFALGTACDRTYVHPADGTPGRHGYALIDAAWQRRLDIDVQGSRSVVVWNPGATGAAAMADVPNDGWPDFLCVEACNAGPDVITLAPGAQHRLQQWLRVTPLA